MTHKELIEKLDRINWTSSLEGKGLQAENWKLKTTFKMHGRRNTELPSVQFVLYLLYNGEIVTTWGCLNEDQPEVVEWFIGKEAAVTSKHYNAKFATQSEGKQIFSEL